MDAGTGLTILGSAVGSAKVLEKMLGPTADYVGEGLKHWTERRVANVQNIFRVAVRKLGNRINDDGAVPPRVLKGILDEGSFCDDPLTTEYYGGVLATSRSGISRDDRGSNFISVVSELSSYQVRSHYIFHSTFRKLFKGSRLRARHAGLTPYFYMPFSGYAKAMDSIVGENIRAIAAHSLNGLYRHDLIDGFAYGEPKVLREWSSTHAQLSEIDADGLIVGLSPFGAELFCYVNGMRDFESVNDFLKDTATFDEGLCGVEIPEGVIKLTLAERYRSGLPDDVVGV